MVVARRHAWLRRNTRSVALIPLLHVGLVGHGLLRIHRHVWHVRAGHVGVLWYAGPAALGREVLVSGLLGGFDLVAAVDAIVIAWSRLRRVQACLQVGI